MYVMFTVMVGLELSGNSRTCRPLERRYSVMPSTLVTRVTPAGSGAPLGAVLLPRPWEGVGGRVLAAAPSPDGEGDLVALLPAGASFAGAAGNGALGGVTGGVAGGRVGEVPGGTDGVCGFFGSALGSAAG